MANNDKKYPKVIVLKRYPYGLVPNNNPSKHFALDDNSELVDELKQHPNTSYYLAHFSPKNKITLSGSKLMLGGKELSANQTNQNNVTINEAKYIIFDEFPYGWSNLAVPSVHYTEDEVKSFISDNPSKKYFFHDKNTRLSLSKSNTLVKTDRPIRRITFWFIIVALSMIVPTVLFFSFFIGSIFLLVHEEKGIRPKQFYTGFSMDLWYHNRARLFISRNSNNVHTEVGDSSLTQEEYNKMIGKLTEDDIYVMVAGTMLYSNITVPEGDGSSTYYMPFQQKKNYDSDGNVTGDNSTSRSIMPIYNLYSQNIFLDVMDWNNQTGTFYFQFQYDYTFSGTVYQANLRGDVKLGMHFKFNDQHRNQNLWNWEIMSDPAGDPVTLSWTILSGSGAALSDTVFEPSLYNDDFSNGYNTPVGAAANKGYLPSLINTDPQSHNLIINTPNVYIRWKINGLKDTNQY